MSNSQNNSIAQILKDRWQVAGLVLLLIFCAIRFVHLDADPPIGLTTSQGVYTDPAAYTLSARNQVLYGDSNPIGDHRFPQFEYNAISAVALVVYKLFGVSYYTSNLTALLFSLTAVILLFFLLRSISIYAAISLLLFLIIDENQYQYGRLPFLENIIVLAGILSFWLLHHARSRWWMAALAGAVMPVAFLFGKAHGAVLVPVFGLFFVWKLFGDIDRSGRTDYFKNSIVPFVIGSIVTAVIWYVTIGAESLSIMREYLAEQSTGIYGSPEAFEGPLQFIWKFMNSGVQSNLNKRIPFVGVAACVMLGVMAYRFFSKPIDTAESSPKRTFNCDVLVFITLWTVFTYIELFPWNYRPLRYQLPLFYGIAALAAIVVGLALDRIFEKQIKTFSFGNIGRLTPFGHAVTFLVEWILVFLITYSVFSIRIALEDGAFVFGDYDIQVTLTSLTIALLIHIGIHFAALKKVQIAKWALAPVIVLGFILTFVVQAKWFYRWIKEPTYMTVAVSKDLEKILGENAVLSGPYGVALAQNNHLKAIVHQFGVADPDTSFFRRYPVTHVLVDDANETRFEELHPKVFEAATLLHTYRITNRKVMLYRVAGASPYRGSYQYELSLFETGVLVAQGLAPDPNDEIGKAFLAMNPDNIAQNLYLGHLAEDRGHLEESHYFYSCAVDASPTDFNLWAELGRVEFQLYKQTGDPMYRIDALERFSRALEINPSAEKVESYLDSLGAE